MNNLMWLYWGMVIILGSVLIRVWYELRRDNIKRKRILNALYPGSSVYVLIKGEPQKVRVLYNSRLNKTITVEYKGGMMDVSWDQVIIEIN